MADAVGATRDRSQCYGAMFQSFTRRDHFCRLQLIGSNIEALIQAELSNHSEKDKLLLTLKPDGAVKQSWKSDFIVDSATLSCARFGPLQEGVTEFQSNSYTSL